MLTGHFAGFEEVSASERQKKPRSVLFSPSDGHVEAIQGLAGMRKSDKPETIPLKSDMLEQHNVFEYPTPFKSLEGSYYL